MVLDLSHGLRVASVANLSGAGLEVSTAPGPLFRVVAAGVEMNSEEFVVERVATEQTDQGEVTRIDLRCDKTPPVVQVSVWVDVTESARDRAPGQHRTQRPRSGDDELRVSGIAGNQLLAANRPTCGSGVLDGAT